MRAASDGSPGDKFGRWPDKMLAVQNSSRRILWGEERHTHKKKKELKNHAVIAEILRAAPLSPPRAWFMESLCLVIGSQNFVRSDRSACISARGWREIRGGVFERVCVCVSINITNILKSTTHHSQHSWHCIMQLEVFLCTGYWLCAKLRTLVLNTYNIFKCDLAEMKYLLTEKVAKNWLWSNEHITTWTNWWRSVMLAIAS